MGSSTFARMLVATGAVIGLSAFAAPAASADNYVAHEGDVAAQQDVTATNGSHAGQDAQNESTQEGVATYVHDNVDASSHKNKKHNKFKLDD